MNTLKFATAFFVMALLTVPPVFAQDPYIYPDKGQSNEQMEKDKFECYSWAKGQTGFDPMQVPTATAPPPGQEGQQGGVVRGAGRGALTGLAVGAIAGDAGKGAAIGAASGALIGGMRRNDQQRRQEQEQQQWAEQESALRASGSNRVWT